MKSKKVEEDYPSGSDYDDDDDSEVNTSSNSDVSDDDHSGSGSDNQDDSDDGDNNDMNMGLGTAEGLADLEKQVNRLAKEDEAALFKMAKAQSSEKEKSKHVANQLRLWQSYLQVRLRLQQPMSIAQRLPPPHLLPEFKSCDSMLEQRLSTASSASAGVLFDLIELERSLASSCPALSASKSYETAFTRPTAWDTTGAAAAAADDADSEKDAPASSSSGKRKRGEGVTTADNNKKNSAGAGTGASNNSNSNNNDDDDMNPRAGSRQRRNDGLAAIETYLSKTWEASTASRNAIIDKWSKRVQVATGKADLTGLKSVNQSLSQQISHALSVDEDRFIQRTRLRRMSQRSLGVAPLAGPAAGVDEDAEARLARERAARVDSEVFDDNDYYTVLVQEVAAMGDAYGSDSGSAFLASRTQDAIANLRRARMLSRNVDRRATKGRRLRFTPIPRLANFMAPVVDAAWIAANASGPESAQEALTDELLMGLFGQQSTAPARPSAAAAAAAGNDAFASLFGNSSSSSAAAAAAATSANGAVGDDDGEEEVYGDFEDVENAQEEEEEEQVVAKETKKGKISKEDKAKGGKAAAKTPSKSKGKSKAAAESNGENDDDDDGDSHFAWFSK